jgi:methylenetetrahydrofolate reductase (NADPH)
MSNEGSSSADRSKFSFEFFPPRTPAGVEKLDKVHATLAAFKPDFFSVTYGAGGSTRDGTMATVLRYKAAGSNVAPHLSFGGASEDETIELLSEYKKAGINRLVALRGDIPSGLGGRSGHRYASELVQFIRTHFDDYFHIEVACYPEIHPDSTGYESDIRYFKQKVDAGANSAITQYFYNADAYFYFVDYCSAAGIQIPIVPGIMPIGNYASLVRFSKGCGAEIPQWLSRRLSTFGEDDPDLRAFGLEVVTSMCEKLLAGGAPGLHFYSMNLAGTVGKLWENLDLTNIR